MNRFLSSIIACACLLSVTGGFAAAGTMSSPAMASKSTTKHMHSCPKGETWVKSYMRNGKKVHGYCRKG